MKPEYKRAIDQINLLDQQEKQAAGCSQALLSGLLLAIIFYYCFGLMTQ
jgi:hypothetical protein